MMAGSATALACDQAIENGKAGAAHLLDAGVGDIDFNDGIFHVRGTNRTIPILELARRMRSKEMPEALAGGMDNAAKFVSPQMSFPNGCHICEVEIDPDTGVVSVVGYTAVDDVGNMLQETIVEGQIHGGIAQGLGQVLGEHVIYSEDGQLLTASFMDYFMPRATDVPALSVHHHVVPCTTNPLGVKGAGESGRCRLPAFRRQRRARCVVVAGRHPSRPADDAAAHLVCSPRQAKGRRNVACATDLPAGPSIAALERQSSRRELVAGGHRFRIGCRVTAPTGSSVAPGELWRGVGFGWRSARN